MTAILRAEPLTATAFAPFGDVIETAGRLPSRINEGHTARYGDLSALDLVRAGGRPCLSLYRTRPKTGALTAMERHRLGSQSFFPLAGRPWLVVVAPPGAFDRGALRAFLVGPSQGVTYRAGTWHHHSLALGAPADFLVIDRAGSDGDCDEVGLDPPLRVELPS